MEMSYMEVKKEIYRLIKKISDHYGGDDREWLKKYAKEIIESHKDYLQIALDCFLDLERSIDQKSDSMIV